MLPTKTHFSRSTHFHEQLLMYYILVPDVFLIYMCTKILNLSQY